MMINKIDRTVSSPPSLSNCRQSVSHSGKSDAIIARRKRTQLRRLNNLSKCDDSLSNRRRFENTEKEVDDDFPYHSSVIGRRREMEDAVSVVPSFVDGNSMKYDFYGVYDGHGGSHVANACRERLHMLLAAEMDIENTTTTEMSWDNLMVECFTKMDVEVNETELYGSMGSTAVVAVVGDKELVVANCGDSRAILARSGATIPLSIDHKLTNLHNFKPRTLKILVLNIRELTKEFNMQPDRPDELKRIELSGGKVIDWNGLRVQGVLATSRSIGDRQLKPYVIAHPEVTIHRRHDQDEFMILASDGLWDVISNDVACHVVRKYLDGLTCRRRESHRRTTNAAVFLTELAMARGSLDNISVIVVNLKQ